MPETTYLLHETLPPPTSRSTQPCLYEEISNDSLDSPILDTDDDLWGAVGLPTSSDSWREGGMIAADHQSAEWLLIMSLRLVNVVFQFCEELESSKTCRVVAYAKLILTPSIPVIL
jgi:hypothetical protein